MKYQEAVDLGLEEYIPDNPCNRGHKLRKVVGRYCIKCKEITDEKYKDDPTRKEKAAKWQKDYRAREGDAHRKYIREYMREYRKTEKHAKWRKKHYDEKLSPKAQRKAQDDSE